MDIGDFAVVLDSDNEKKRALTSNENRSNVKMDTEMKADDDVEDDLDYVFNEIGECSMHQMWKYVFIFLPIALSAIYAISFVVTGSSLDYRCVIVFVYMYCY